MDMCFEVFLCACLCSYRQTYTHSPIVSVIYLYAIFSATLIRKNSSDSFQDLNRCPLLLCSCNHHIQWLPTYLPKATGFIHPQGISGNRTHVFSKKGQYRHRAISTRQLFLTRKNITPTLAPGDQTRGTTEHNPCPLIVATQRREAKLK